MTPGAALATLFCGRYGRLKNENSIVYPPYRREQK